MSYNRFHMRETYRPMVENARPFTRHEKRRHKIRTQPWITEYHVDPAPLPEMTADAKPGLGMFLLAMLCALIDLPESADSGIEGGKVTVPKKGQARSLSSQD